MRMSQGIHIGVLTRLPKTLGVTTMEIYIMVSNGVANLGEPVREVLTRPHGRRVGLRRKCAVEVTNEDGTIRVFENF